MEKILKAETELLKKDHIVLLNRSRLLSGSSVHTRKERHECKNFHKKPLCMEPTSVLTAGRFYLNDIYLVNSYFF